MDFPPITPSAFFSPSKAAAQRAQAKDWHFIDTWLAARRLGTVQFERNDATLKALLALMGASERADEERELVWTVEAEAVEELREKVNEPDWIDALLGEVGSAMDARSRQMLESLSSLMVQYDATGYDAESLAHAILSKSMPPPHATTTASSLLPTFTDTTITRLAHTQSTLPTPHPDLATQTLDLARATKTLRAKIAEYTDRLGSASPAKGEEVGVDVVGRVVEREREVERLRGEVERLEREREAWKGLPRGVEEARREVGRVEGELGELRGRREGLFAKMAR
ncbi:hypothetical protein P152DRAFT_69372 [Eremomyces bilateralis CBS 781.70]|uniref:HAUS augmin-like complex subunit 1 n=1 Tax=Eremomyces bilateralis CBS 781.70 TaxID=1392243 RepID=A0A6G1G068_9PEZI|nr:uncharacterized protein P152DRAFT_69372 [Eremomyces bilateralis CBS 781.70]KAF1811320.1 hypothetical protein P152DRAFT_69372 [Eremomyces bilateralis CBS 781.70]